MSGTPSGRKWHDADRGESTVNFPGEAPLDSVLAALPAAPAVTAAAPRRSGRAPAPKVIADAPDERGPAQKRRAKKQETPIVRKKLKRAEGAYQNSSGKWSNFNMFPGREFDDLDAYRAAKKQRAEQRAAYSNQNIRLPKGQPPRLA